MAALVKVFLCLLLCFSGSHLITSALVVSSNWKMTRLADFELNIVRFARSQSAELPQSFINFVSSIEVQYARHDLFTFVNFPINLYRLIRRFTYEWPNWRARLERRLSKASSKFLNYYDQLSQQLQGIDKIQPDTDLPIATNSLSLIHLLYGEESGLLPSDKPTDYQPLTEIELLELSADSFANSKSKNKVFHSLHWLQVFVDQVGKYFPFWPLRDIILYVMRSNDLYGVANPANYSLRIADRLERLGAVIYGREHSPHLLQLRKDNMERDIATKACRGSSVFKKGDFYCFRFHSPHAPFAPFKYEILNREPYVALVHDFMTQQKTHEFIQGSINAGTTISEVVGNFAKTQQMGELKPDVRLSESTLIHPHSKINMWLDQRVELATLLEPHSQPVRKRVFDGETVHILHYGLSGYYHAHEDFFGGAFETNGIERLATVLIYLNDVKSGGYTVFPLLGLFVPPKTGAALVWFNLDPVTGSPIPTTLHAACPVNIGKKWVINRWIRTHLRVGYSRPVWK